MSWNPDRSPVGWYLGSYLLRFVEIKDPRRNDPDARFHSWENTVLVKATTIQRAFAKTEKIGRSQERPYLGGKPPGVLVRWEYLGVTDVVPIYEPLEDGSEIAWTKRSPRKLRRLREMASAKPKPSRAVKAPKR